MFIHWSLLLDIVAFGDHRLFSCTFYENADSICIDFVRLDWDLDLALGQGTKRHSARIRVTLFGGSYCEHAVLAGFRADICILERLKCNFIFFFGEPDLTRAGKH